MFFDACAPMGTRQRDGVRCTKQVLEAFRRLPSGSVSPLVSANDKAKAAEAERIVSPANQAAKESAKQQTQLVASMKAMSAAKGKGKSKEENKGKINKQVKAEKFFDKESTQMANKKWANGTKVGRIGR